MLPVLCIFALTYILIFSLPEHQWLVAAGSALCLVAGGFLSPMSAILAIDTNIRIRKCPPFWPKNLLPYVQTTGLP